MVRPIEWQLATVTAVRDETPTVRSLTLSMPAWDGHRPGQHVDIRLTADDGYSVERSYSIGSEPERGAEIDLTVERIDDGEVSPFLHDVIEVGDRFEVRGPIGGYFVWEAIAEMDVAPLLLVAGGSGVVPLMAMIRHRARAGARNPATLLFSSRHSEEIIYRAELDELAARGDGLTVVHTLTRSQPQGWTGYARRIDRAMLAEVLERIGMSARTYICGPTALVESAADSLVRLGLPPDRVRTERFGPSGT
jgi:ferredoxin-NADP reductase